MLWEQGLNLCPGIPDRNKRSVFFDRTDRHDPPAGMKPAFSLKPRRIFFKRYAGFFLFVTALWGCAVYHPMPPTSEIVSRSLKTPDMREVRVHAGMIKHPLLKPITFDDRDGLSPAEAAVLAVIANPGLRACRDRMGIAEAQLLEAGILPNPRLSYNFERPVGGATEDTLNALGLGLEWNISALISRGARIDAAKAGARSVDLEVAWEEWQVAEAAKRHVFRLAIAQKRLTMAAHQQAILEKLYEKMKHGTALGVRTRQGLSDVEAQLFDMKSAVLEAGSNMAQERLALKRVLGMPTETDIRLEKGIRLPTTEKMPSVEALTTDIEDRRLDLLAFKLGYESREARVRAAIRSQFPGITIGFSGARDTDRVRTLGAGISIDLPFFDHNQGRIAVERASRKQMFDEYISRLFNARADIARIAAGICVTRNRIANMEASLAAIKKLAEAYQKAAEARQVDISDYYHMMTQLYDKQDKRIKLDLQMADFIIAIEIASGRYGLFGCDDQVQSGSWKN